MNRFLARAALVLLASLVSAPAAAAEDARGPVKVFILAGQSNMEGYGAVAAAGDDGVERKGTLKHLAGDPGKASLVAGLLETDSGAKTSKGLAILATNESFGDPAPNVMKTLRVEYTLGGKKGDRTVNEGEELTIPPGAGDLVVDRATYGDLPAGASKDVTAAVREIAASGGAGGPWRVRDDVWVWFEGRKGPLTVGFGANKSLFGAELGFGQVMGDLFEEPVLIIKTAWGGQSLYKDFRPPSSGGEVGQRYRDVLETVRKVIANLPAEFPGAAGRGTELAGLVWWHGWNDGCDPTNAVPEYETNLVHLIEDLRRDLGAARLPVVVGELTGPWIEVGGEWGALRKAQAAAAARPPFAGNVSFVETHDFVRKEEDSPGGWPCHEFNNAETYLLVGRALGEGMKKLLPAPAR